MKQLFTNRGIFQVLLAFLLVISIMSVSNYIVYRNSISGIYDKMAQVNTLAVQNMIQTFDNNFRTIYNMIHTIHGMPFENMEYENSTQIDMSRVYSLQDQISNLINSTDYIEEAIVFYDDIDLAITSRGTSSFSHLFNEKYKHNVYNASYWRSYMKTRNSLRVFPSEMFTISTSTNVQQGKRNLMIVTGGNKVKMSNKNIILLINEADFMKDVQQNLLIPGSSLVVLDQDRRVIADTGSDWNIQELFDKALLGAAKEASVTKENYEYHLFKSDYNGYIYIEKLPYQFQNIESVTSANRIIMIISILSAIMLSILLSVYLNKPIKNILKQFGTSNSRGNDFVKIHSGIIKMQHEVEQYRNQIAEVDEHIQRTILLRSFDEYDQKVIDDGLMQLYVPGFFKLKHFLVISIHVEKNPGSEESQLAADAIAQMLTQALPANKLAMDVVYEKDFRYLAVIGLDQPTDREPFIKQLARILGQLEKNELSNYTLWASVSRNYLSEVDNCKKAFGDVKLDMQFRNVRENANVIDVEKIRYQWMVYNPFEQIEKLSNFLLNGKLKESKDVIAEIIEENRNRNINYHQFIHLAKSMFYSMLKHVDSLPNDTQELLQIEQKFLESLTITNNYVVIEQELYKVAKLVAKQSKQETANKLNPSFISQYIELHYMENLYLDDIAEVTETSPKYFSSYFKRTFGVNYVEYLNKVRLSHARELLKDTNLTIAEIGEKTGYLNSSTFTTTFKKYFGISPSEYRKQCNS